MLVCIFPRGPLAATYLAELIPSERIKGRVVLTFRVIEASVEEPTPVLRTLAAAIQIHGSMLLTRMSFFLTYFHPLPPPPLCLTATCTSGPPVALFSCGGVGRGAPGLFPTSLGTFETGRGAPSRQVLLGTVGLPFIPPAREGCPAAFSVCERALKH